MTTGGLAIGGAGWAGFFYCGVLQSFRDAELAFDRCLAVSSGAPSAVLALLPNIDIKDVVERYLRWARLRGKQQYTVFHGYRDFIERYVSDDMARSLSGRLTVQVTQMWPPRLVYFDQFRNRQELLHALAGSSTLPYLFPFPYRVNGRAYVDGGFLREDRIQRLGGGNVVHLMSSSGAGVRSAGRTGRHHVYPGARAIDPVRRFVPSVDVLTRWYEHGRQRGREFCAQMVDAGALRQRRQQVVGGSSGPVDGRGVGSSVDVGAP